MKPRYSAWALGLALGFGVSAACHVRHEQTDRQRHCYEQLSPLYRAAEQRFGPSNIQVIFDPTGGYGEYDINGNEHWFALPWSVELPSYPTNEIGTGATLDEAIRDALAAVDADAQTAAYQQHQTLEDCLHGRGCR